MAPTSPQTPIKPNQHNGGGRGDQSSQGEPALHQSMCLFKQEASSLEHEGHEVSRSHARVAKVKALASGQERLSLVLDQYRTFGVLS